MYRNSLNLNLSKIIPKYKKKKKILSESLDRSSTPNPEEEKEKQVHAYFRMVLNKSI